MKPDELLLKIEMLETRQAFHEDTIESLNLVIIQQQKDIDMMQLKIEVIQERVKQTSDSVSQTVGEEPPPPHY